MTDKDKEFKITRGPMKGKKVRLAPQEETESFQYELEQVLDIIGHPEALVTDWSSISDFFSSDDPEAVSDCMTRIGEAFGIEVTDPDERLVNLARRLRKARKERK